MKTTQQGSLLPGLLFFVIAGCQQEVPVRVAGELNSEIQSLVEPFHANRDFSGVVAVSQNGNLVGMGTVGFPDIDHTSPHDLHTSFHIASISKTFTAAAIRTLVSRGILTLGTPLSDFLPEFPAGNQITILNLLEHSSGIPDFWSLPEVWDFMARTPNLEELVDWLGDYELDFEPGSSSSYSNSGYAVLAAVIEKASGLSYHDYLEAHVFPAAGLSETAAFRNETDAVGFIPSFDPGGIKPSPKYDPSILIGSGSLKSTASDLLAWCEAFNKDYLNPATDTFIYGWGVRSENGRNRAEQTGRNPGFSSHLRAYPDSNTCVVVLSNIESDAVATLGADASSAVFGESFTLPSERTVISIPENTLRDYVGRFEISEGREVEISIGPDGLLLRGTNGPFLPLEALANDKFFYRQLYTTIHAERDATGRVSALLWGGSWRLPRID